MQFCSDHWQQMRGAVEERGLSRFIAKTGEAAMKGLVNPSPDDFDPLMFIHNQIVGKAIEAFGIAVMMPNEDGSERCPLCTFEEDHIARCQTPGCTFSHAELAIKNTLDWAQNYIREHLEAAEG